MSNGYGLRVSLGALAGVGLGGVGALLLPPLIVPGEQVLGTQVAPLLDAGVDAAAPEPDALPPSDLEADPEPSPNLAPDAEELLGPGFDVVRVEPGGASLVAGRGEPGGTVSVLADDEVVAEAAADGEGRFVALFNLAPSAQPRALSLRQGTATSAETVILAPVEEQVAAALPGEGKAPGDVPTVGSAVQDEGASEPGAAAAPGGPSAASDLAALATIGDLRPLADQASPDAEPRGGEPVFLDPGPALRDGSPTDPPISAGPALAAGVASAPPATMDTAGTTDVGATAGATPPADPAWEGADPASPPMDAGPARAEATSGPPVEDSTGSALLVAPDMPVLLPGAAEAGAPASPPPGLSAPLSASLGLPQPASPFMSASALPEAAPGLATAPVPAPPLGPLTGGGVFGRQDSAPMLPPAALSPSQPVEVVAPSSSPIRDPAPRRGPAPEVTGEAPAPPPSEPAEPNGQAAVLMSDASGVRVLQPALAPGAGPEVLATVALDAIAYDGAGEVLLSGRGTAGDTVRLYLDNRPMAEARIASDGTWRAPLGRTDPGVYTLRLDQLDAAGEVVSRIESPFKRERRDEIAAAVAEAEAEGQGAALRIVQPGNTLWAIARDRYGEPLMYVRVFEANRDRIRNPDLIYPGQVFVLPADGP